MIRYYHKSENIETGQTVIEPYANMSENKDHESLEDIQERFFDDYDNTDIVIHRLMSERDLEELKNQIERALIITR